MTLIVAFAVAVSFIYSAQEAAMAQSGDAPTVLITGSNRGIGLELARQYTEKGWTVIATHRRDDRMHAHWFQDALRRPKPRGLQ